MTNQITPSRESVYVILDEEKNPVALVRNKVMYSVDPLDDDGIIEKFMNGGDVLPIVQNQLRKEI